MRHSSTASLAVIVYRTGPEIGKRTPPKVQERGADLQAVGDLTHTVVEHRVARDPEDAMFLPVPLKSESDHLADDRVAQRGAMATRCGSDLDGRPFWRLEPCTRPRRKTASLTA